jgi:hypothetical protein
MRHSCSILIFVKVEPFTLYTFHLGETIKAFKKHAHRSFFLGIAFAAPLFACGKYLW